MVDIGPTAAAVLGMSFAEAEGLPIDELLKPGVIPPRTKPKQPSRKPKAETQQPR
jgi:hypothetical protein